jgi:phosphinothricin acetyltransferase
VGDRIVGVGSLTFFEGSAKHRGEVRIFLSKDFRRRGLGTKMTQALIEYAKRKNLYLLEVQVVRDLTNDIKAMQKVGFEHVSTVEDYFMLPDGEPRDVVIMILRLRSGKGSSESNWGSSFRQSSEVHVSQRKFAGTRRMD